MHRKERNATPIPDLKYVEGGVEKVILQRVRSYILKF